MRAEFSQQSVPIPLPERITLPPKNRVDVLVPGIIREEMRRTNPPVTLEKIQIIGNYVPRRCGIATFTTDLTEAIAAEFPRVGVSTVAINDIEAGYEYPGRVGFEIAEKDLGGYHRAADFLNINDVDVVSLQHEYGIFGGKAGSYILQLMSELRMPIVTTLHTILREPNPLQKEVMDKIIELSERVVVMSETGAGFLKDVHGIDESKVRVIHHGIRDIRFESTRAYKERLGVAGDQVILTFGLLGPDKGIENVIQALPKIIQKHPNTVYMVVGETHPNIRAHHGETYRLGLERLARELGVASHVVFHNRFVSDAELKEFLGAADVYTTPYLKLQQITSGTLAYAVGSGKAVVSTPYWYAEELLANGRGILVPPADPGAIAEAIGELLSNDSLRRSMRRKAAEFGRQMVWPSVARQYMAVLEDAVAKGGRRKQRFHTKTLDLRPASLPDVNLSHLRLMTDDTGMLQHATYTVPNYDEGYCVDDNARALTLVTLLDEDTHEAKDLRQLTSRYLAFLNHSLNKETGRFRNFLSYDRRWLEDIGSEDSHGRAIEALGRVVGRSSSDAARGIAKRLFDQALPTVTDFSSPRAWAFSLLGIEEYLRSFMGDSRVEDVREILANKLLRIRNRTAGDDWPWFEEYLTYCNSILPHALLVSGQWMGRGDMVGAGLASLEWLAELQRSTDGLFWPIGSNGFYNRGSTRAEFDQQPVEAAGMVSAALDAHRVTGDDKWSLIAKRAFYWFLGENVIQTPLYDPATGGCRDGLHEGRANENEGAESTIACLTALVEMRLAGNLSTTNAALRVNK